MEVGLAHAAQATGWPVSAHRDNPPGEISGPNDWRAARLRIFCTLKAPARRLACALLIIATPCAGAHAEVRLSAQYTISIAGIPIGRGELMAEIGEVRYAAAGSGRASGFLRILVSGEGNVTTAGRLIGGQPVPANFGAVLNDEDERSSVDVRFDNGAATEISATSSAPKENRIPLRDEHRTGVIDPVSAMLVPSRPDAPSAQACRRTLPIFDGTRRYDIVLSFKRDEKVKAGDGRETAVVVCAAALRPIAGHRADSALVKYLSAGRDLELWLTPIAHTNLLGPYRLSVANLIGDLVIEAVRFEATETPVTAAKPKAATR